MKENDMKNIVMVYSSMYGQTQKICLRLQELLEKKDNKKKDNKVTLIAINDIKTVDLSIFDKIIIASSIKYGKHNKKIQSFVKANKQLINSKPNAFFSVNATARKEGKDVPETNRYLKKFIKKTQWQPQHLAIFAGAIKFQKYTMLERFIIRNIMKITKGPTDPMTDIEYTNWQKVEEFSLTLDKM